MAFASWALVMATIVLAIITYCYMRHTKKLADETKKMADIMVKDFEVKVTPLIDMKVRRLHSTRGFENTITLLNQGFYPIRIHKIVMKWWYESKPTNPYYKEEPVDGYLYKDNPISKTITIRDDEIKNPEFPESEPLNGAHLGKIVAASILVSFYDVNGRVQQTTPKVLDPLM